MKIFCRVTFLLKLKPWSYSLNNFTFYFLWKSLWVWTKYQSWCLLLKYHLKKKLILFVLDTFELSIIQRCDWITKLCIWLLSASWRKILDRALLVWLNSLSSSRNRWWLCLPPLVNKSCQDVERPLKKKTTHILFPVSAFNFTKILMTLLIIIQQKSHFS